MYKQIVRPLLFRFQEDSVHESTIKWASYASESRLLKRATKRLYNYQSPALEQTLFGLKFRNPVGLAAGFDKNGTITALMEALGFGFVEIGSITAQASSGNPLPRSFRLTGDSSLINRMGLNNEGAETVTDRLKSVHLSIPLGINIAKTHNPDIYGSDALEDYRKSFVLAKDVADYITINISCPNTREGKTFETPDTLEELLQSLTNEKPKQTKTSFSPPLLIKFSADLDQNLLRELIDVSLKFPVSGYVATNTSVLRDELTTRAKVLEKIGKGGLSGKAIHEKSNRVIRLIHEYTRGEKPIIGVGGIFSSEDAIEKIRAGADLLQIYTGLIYEGPSLVRVINRGIDSFMKKENLTNISDIRG